MYQRDPVSHAYRGNLSDEASVWSNYEWNVFGSVCVYVLIESLEMVRMGLAVGVRVRVCVRVCVCGCVYVWICWYG